MSAPATVGIVDYGMGNRRSVEKALERVGARALVTGDHEALMAADGLIVPGVGAFPAAMRSLRATGLGLIPGTVSALDARGAKLPHIGWNEVTFRRPAALTAGLGEAAAFYHVHSFVCRPADEDDVVGRGSYGEPFASVVARENVMGAQFHPEKSSRDGLALLRNFARLADRNPAARPQHLPA